MDNSRKLFPTLDYAVSAHEACDKADVVLVLTEWEEFVSLNPSDLEPFVRQRNIIDGRNCLDASSWKSAGWRYCA